MEIKAEDFQGGELMLSGITSDIKENDSPEAIRTKIAAFEAACEEYASMYPAQAITELPLKHTFTDGVYVREIFIPKGLIVVGKIHRHEHLNFISRGEVTVVTEHEGVERLIGPCTIISKAGTKRVLYTHEDTVWTTVHANPENITDLSVLEGGIITKTYAEIGMLDPVVEHLKLKEA